MTVSDAPTFLTVRELAELLRVKERKVYDLAASGEVPCSRATGKLLFPRDQVEAWISSRQAGPSTRRAQVFLGSHDPLLEWALRQSQSGLATNFQSSRDGLKRFAANEGVATGLHLRDPGGDWNLSAVKSEAAGCDAALVSWAVRSRGLVIRPEDRHGIRGPKQLSGRRLASRQKGAGAEEAWAQILEEEGVDPASVTACPPSLSEQDAIIAVAQGEADATFGLKSMAKVFGLYFVPLIDERFDLLISRRDWFEPPLQTLFEFARSEPFHEQAARLGGYQITKVGSVLWNA